jgi:molecular chaperone GrpE
MNNHHNDPTHNDSCGDEEPQFGLVDIIEAFTAMRQELRTQSRETRDLSQSLIETSSGIVEIEERLHAAAARIEAVAAESRGDDESRRMAETIAEIDQHVLRAVQAIHRSSTMTNAPPSLDTDALRSQLTASINSLGSVGRWFAKPLIAKLDAIVDQWRASQPQPQGDNATTQGLNMLVDRIARLMNDQQIERVETLGETFDGETMNAIDAVASESQSRGTVLEQLAPGYRYRGRVIKYAQVRIAT